jgi:endonuclease/exonuclease/phosphatase (EEP) superfamily protein YafD
MTRLRLILLVASLPAAVVCLLAPTAGWWLPGELSVHWSRHAALALLPALAVWRYHDCCTGLLLGCFLCGLAPWLSAPRLADPPVLPAAAPTLRVVSANLLAFTDDQAPGLGAVLDRGADVVVLVEFRPNRADAAICADGRYPFRVVGPVFPRDPNHALAVLSRYPLDQVMMQPSGREIAVRIATPGGPLRLIAVHLPTPTTPGRITDRRATLVRLGETAARADGPLVIAGDWNCTVASPDWRPIARSGLSTAPGWHAGTWPSHLFGLGIRIDHILAHEAAVNALVTFRIPRSDHLGIEALIALAPSAPGRAP